MSTTPNLDITEMEQSQSSKEVTYNTAIGVLDTFAGPSSQAIVNGTNTLTEAQAQAALLVLTGALTATATVVIPATLGKLTLVTNQTTGGQTVNVKIGTG